MGNRFLCSDAALQDMIDSPYISEDQKVALREEKEHRRRVDKITMAPYAIGDAKLMTQDNPETLGDIAEIFRKWKEESGITQESILYVLGKVYWED